MSAIKYEHYDVIIPAPFGAIGAVVQDDFVVAIELLSVMPAATPGRLAFCQNVAHQLSQYLAHADSPFSLPYALTGTAFQKRVWQAIAAIPRGQTLNYGELAEKVGSGPRAVANACGANRLPLIIPCHRVVAKNGLGGFMQGNDPHSLSIKQWLLAHENAAL